MKARIEPFNDGLGNISYRLIGETKVWAAAIRGQRLLEEITEAAFVPFDPPEEPRYPPPCDGNNAGNVLANAQFEAAVDGDECTSGVCLAVRGAND